VESELSQTSNEQFRANRFALISRLADDLAHEIKNPLNSIVINLEVLKVRVTKGDAEAALDRAAVIEHELRRLHQLMDRLLQLLRPDREDAANLAVDATLDELLPLIEAQARLARNDVRVACRTTGFVAVRRDVFKFALLNLLIAMHDRLGEGGGAMIIACGCDDMEVSLRIHLETSGGELSVSPQVAPDFERAVGVASALLEPTGGRIESGSSGVSVILPRAASL
jgi:phosphoglycerate-specific signal transduction histidine kinase